MSDTKEEVPNLNEVGGIDPIDLAAGVSLISSISGVSEARRAFNLTLQQPNEDGSYDITTCECGEPIIPERLAHGFKLCVECQTARERSNKWKR